MELISLNGEDPDVENYGEDANADLLDRVLILHDCVVFCRDDLLVNLLDPANPEPVVQVYERLISWMNLSLGLPEGDRSRKKHSEGDLMSQLLWMSNPFAFRIVLEKLQLVFIAILSFTREHLYGVAAQYSDPYPGLVGTNKLLGTEIDRAIGSSMESDGYIFGESYDALDSLAELIRELYDRKASRHEDPIVRADDGTNLMAEGR